MEVGQVVISKAGRDKAYFLVIVGFDEGYVFLCDGRERPLERPKRKNQRHVAFTNMRLGKEAMAGNKALRKALRELREGAE